jgi:beta-glucosidase
VRLLEGMTKSKPEGVNLTYSRGCDWTEDIETLYGEGGDERAWEYELLHRKVDSGEKADKAEALLMAREADVIVAAVGENVMLCGENRDRKGLRLPGKQEQFVDELIKTGKPVVLVIFGGRAQVVSGIAERCAAVIQAWYPGEEGGRAVADILYGKVSPSAKLSVSYPNTEIKEPICYNYSAEKDSRIQWPFGYGLSYTTFEYSNLKVDKEAATNSDAISVTFDLKNTGKMAADEVAQVYISPNDDTPLRPIQLQGFARVSLKPGESKKISVKMYTEQLGYYTHDGQRQWNIQPGKYIIKVGASSQDIKLQQEINVSGEPVKMPLRKFYFSEAKQI